MVRRWSCDNGVAHIAEAKKSLKSETEMMIMEAVHRDVSSNGF